MLDIVDILCDFRGYPIFITPQICHIIHNGEVLKTEVSQDHGIITDMKCFVASLRPCGPLTVHMIKQRKTGYNYYIGIKPRFDCIASLSIKAGADSAEMLLRLLNNDDYGIWQMQQRMAQCLGALLKA